MFDLNSLLLEFCLAPPVRSRGWCVVLQQLFSKSVFMSPNISVQARCGEQRWEKLYSMPFTAYSRLKVDLLTKTFHR